MTLSGRIAALQGPDRAVDAEVVHFISAMHDRGGNWTACGKAMVYPMRGNGWRVQDISCPACDRLIVALAHEKFRDLIATLTKEPT